jgi:hypothetical protein
MKHQFFGDINDYRKYGLLRILCGGKKDSTAVCWMLTADIGGPNGKKIGYLHEPDDWEYFDHSLFYALHQAVIIYSDRNVARAEHPGILDPAIFDSYSEQLKDKRDEREKYFQEFLSRAEGRDLVFFDPDNGLEVKGLPAGRKGSSKFLYFDELSRAFNRQHSILVFQFFMKIAAEKVINERTKQVFSRLDVDEIASFKTNNVIFFLIPQTKDLKQLKERSERVGKVWSGQINPCWHHRTGHVSDAEGTAELTVGDENEKDSTIP